jgi:hypothetical protein
VSIEGEAVVPARRLFGEDVQLSGAGARQSAGSPPVSALFAGDICVGQGTALPTPGQAVPWAQFAGEIRAHHLSLANLECPLTLRGRPIEKLGPVLRGDPSLARVIADGGFDGVTLANNHILDAGPVGVGDTIMACHDAGLSTVGAGMDLAAAQRPLELEAEGVRIAVVACAEREASIAGPWSPGAAPLDPWTTPDLVREAAGNADVVIAVVHGGNEQAALPRPGLVAACRGLVAAGARAVVCHHSHVAGSVEVFRGAPIFYGTGNFCFPGGVRAPQGWHVGYAVSLLLSEDGVISFRLLPYEQCVTRLAVLPLGEREETLFATRLGELAAAVHDPDVLAAAWETYCRDQRRHYLHMALGLTRLERRLLRYGIWPSWRRPRRRVPELLDAFTCDSHREALELVLRREMGC